ncbi:MAG: hypothetical protein WCF20_08575 [Methylovirgula sp.]
MTPRILITRFAVLVSFFCLLGCSSSGGLNTRLSASECVLHAKQVLYDADFTENLAVSRETASVSGHHGGYHATVHCETGNQVIHVDVDGLDPIQTEWYRKVIIKKF